MLGDADTAQGDEIAWFKDKVADLEERSRRNKLKLRGIPESAPHNQLLQYAHTLFSTLVLTLTVEDLIVDRIYRVPKPSFFLKNTKGCVTKGPLRSHEGTNPTSIA